MSADEKRVREFAYQIWESEGQPDGQEERHWEMARKLAEAEALAPDKKDVRKTAKPKLPKVDGAGDAKPMAPKPAAKPVAKAASKPAPKTTAAPASTPVAAPVASTAKKPSAPRKPSAT
ncbi:DUF2934 domain-containing protein [Pseudomonas sp. CCI3.2]|uniref:DUF2934 domain-containing protein n=1 Tax=unclassified Pseudomonas TaxID=196821 RepID=UPI002AC8A05B|nr:MULTISPECIES: DUF2934 domain-containing protein [unclassified Pseudomonas]MEB0076167.1 DUF2934 domain-containing protein [Pseudomonas sp. MH10out]MEB0090662.1 DUF2934 domain-containing protein [Pseudomonas sp. CCI4.2]MEB0103795.1 DUF2934 domain-containing protein [Pseudomonas sp. CCI3.2]MEB0131837.1 DUF2934 domain-containing protein [Pseudomonas sp. CCI2.4]MEB0156080.1 DUF2934 domain-containing protein [Pseudomonas sp. AH2 (2023)]